MLKVLCQAMTLEGVKQGQYVTVMPDLAADRLQRLETKIKGSLTGGYRASLRGANPPIPFIKDLQSYFHSLFQQCFKDKFRLKAARECWVSDDQVPGRIKWIIKDLNRIGRHEQNVYTATVTDA